jgi:hypothetical protein
MFGDNESVVNSSMRLDAKLHKRHNALSFHRVREAIAAGYIQYFHVPGKSNLQPFLFWKGDTATIEENDTMMPHKETNMTKMNE